MCPGPAIAYRPFDSTDAAVAATGELELEVGPIGFVKEGADRALVAPTLILNWGVAERWELVLEGRHFVELGGRLAEPRFRVEEIALSVKTVLREGALQDRHGVSVASELSLLLPTVNGPPGIGWEEAVIVSQRWTELTVHLNAALAWTRRHRVGGFAGAIVEIHDTWPIRPVMEIFVEPEAGVPTVVSGLVGAIWRIAENLSVDGGVRVARAGALDTFEIRAGFTWGFPVGRTRERRSP